MLGRAAGFFDDHAKAREFALNLLAGQQVDTRRQDRRFEHQSNFARRHGDDARAGEDRG